MKTIIAMHMLGETATGTRFNSGYARKTVDLSFAPSVGMELECLAWKDPKKVKGSSLNLEDGSLFLMMGLEKYADPREFNSVIATYRSLGWEVKLTYEADDQQGSTGVPQPA